MILAALIVIPLLAAVAVAGASEDGPHSAPRLSAGGPAPLAASAYAATASSRGPRRRLLAAPAARQDALRAELAPTREARQQPQQGRAAGVDSRSPEYPTPVCDPPCVPPHTQPGYVCMTNGLGGGPADASNNMCLPGQASARHEKGVAAGAGQAAAPGAATAAAATAGKAETATAAAAEPEATKKGATQNAPVPATAAAPASASPGARFVQVLALD